MKLNILEQVPLYANHSAEATLQELVELAQVADNVGYHRFWLAEHHNTTAFLSSAPDILAGHLLAKTQNIRVGTGGVMAMHYGSLQIAERFNLLASLFPNRVDLGLGRAPGTDLYAAKALNQNHLLNPHEIDALIEETIHFIRQDFPLTHSYGQFVVSPTPQSQPEIWLLGSSGQSAQWAGDQSISYAYAYFFTGYQDVNVMNEYRQHFVKKANYQPNTLSALAVIAAETQAEAEFLSLSMLDFRYCLERGLPVTFKSPAEIMQLGEAYVNQLKSVAKQRNNALIGTYDDVCQQIKEFAQKYQTDEIMLVTYLADHQQKLTMYQEIAKRML